MIQNLHNKLLKICTINYSKSAQQNTQNLHNRILKICTTKHSKFAQQNTQNLHNKLLKVWTNVKIIKKCSVTIDVKQKYRKKVIQVV